jgi:hypothetical protein
MLNLRRLAFPLVALALTTAATASAAPTVAATERKQWTVDSSQVMTNQPLRLTNLVHDSALAYKATAPGLKLYWGGTGSTVYGGTWYVHQRDPSTNVRDHRARPLANGETAALYNPYQPYPTTRGTQHGMYLSYNEQSRTAQLQWKINKGGAVEWTFTVDPATKQLSLYNTRKRDYLVYDQSTGLIGWLNKQPTTQGAVHDASVTMSAQPVTQGYVPFLGYFGGGGGFNSVLTEVRNPANGYALWFVKPGHSTTECGSSSAVIPLAPGAALTAEQMTTLYGSATPTLKNNRLPFLACSTTPYSSVFVNVKYRDV